MGILATWWGKSNCHLYADRKLRTSEAEFLCVRFTDFSIWEFFPKWLEVLWYPLRLVGFLIVNVAWILLHIGELIGTRRWFHVTAILWDGTMIEFVPLWKKKKLAIPPILFTGQERRVEPHTIEQENDRRQRLADRRNNFGILNRMKGK